jgi:hypothetical protein
MLATQFLSGVKISFGAIDANDLLITVIAPCHPTAGAGHAADIRHHFGQMFGEQMELELGNAGHHHIKTPSKKLILSVLREFVPIISGEECDGKPFAIKEIYDAGDQKRFYNKAATASLRMKISALSLKRALSFRICSRERFRCPLRNMLTADSVPNSGIKSFCER